MLLASLVLPFDQWPRQLHKLPVAQQTLRLASVRVQPELRERPSSGSIRSKRLVTIWMRIVVWRLPDSATRLSEEHELQRLGGLTYWEAAEAEAGPGAELGVFGFGYVFHELINMCGYVYIESNIVDVQDE